MRKLIVSLVAVVAATSANAMNVKQYASLGVSGVFGGTMSADMPETDRAHMVVDTKSFFGGHIAYGVKLNDFRIELEGSMYTSQKPDSDEEWVDMYNRTVFLNGYFDLKSYGIVTPYVGAGIGYNNINIKIDEADFDKNYNTLAYKLAAGLSFKIDNTFAVDAGYRYTYFGKPNGKIDGAEFKLAGHEAYLGARINF